MRLMLKGQEFHNYFFGQRKKKGKIYNMAMVNASIIAEGSKVR